MQAGGSSTGDGESRWWRRWTALHEELLLERYQDTLMSSGGHVGLV